MPGPCVLTINHSRFTLTISLYVAHCTLDRARGLEHRKKAQRLTLMKNFDSYAAGLLALTTVLISSDGEISEKELDYTQKIRESEGISDALFYSIRESILGKTEREVYQIGIDSINTCTEEEKLRAFVKMYQMAMADGVIHVKEVRLLLYAVKITHVDINTVVNLAERQAVAII